MSSLQQIIEAGFAEQSNITAKCYPPELKIAVDTIMAALNDGSLRIAEKKNNEWIVNQWLKKAILIYFQLKQNQVINTDYCQFYDKIPLKFSKYKVNDFDNAQVRVVPAALVRYGAFIGKNSILMPSYVNIGAYIDQGVMVDTWATVGSCAQIGKNVHLSGGVGIGGVLEPLQANPTIIEDNCFIGARSEVVEGVIVEHDSVLSMGVFLSQSTKIYNRLTERISYGRIPAGSVVVPGTLPSSDGKYSLYCAVIVKEIDAKTRAKVNINELLRA